MFDSEAKASIVRVHPQAAARRRDRSRTRELLTGPATSKAAGEVVNALVNEDPPRRVQVERGAAEPALELARLYGALLE